MTASRRTVGLVALGAAAVLGAGVGATMSLTSSRTPAPSGGRGAGEAAANLVDTGATVAAGAGAGAPAGEARPATVIDRASVGSSSSEGQLRARSAAVTTAVRKRYPEARVLGVTLHQDGTSLVALTFAAHRAGTATVDAHLHVGVFHPQPGQTAPTTTDAPMPAAPMPAAPTTEAPPTAAPPTAAPGTGTVGGDGAISGRHW